MDPARRILRRLGFEGIRLVAGHLLGRRSLLRAAAACRLTYAGKRIRSVPTPTLLTVLSRKIVSEPDLAPALTGILDGLCADAVAEVEEMEPGALRRLGRSRPPDPRRGARLLYALAADPRKDAGAAAAAIRKMLAASGSRWTHTSGPAPESVAGGRPSRDEGAPGGSLSECIRSLEGILDQARRDLLAKPRMDREASADLVREIRATRTELARISRSAARRAPRRDEGPARVGLFVDVQNMYYAARQIGARLDFGALREEVSRDRRLVSAIAYVVEKPDVDQGGFLAMLAQRDFEVRRKPLKTRADGSSKGDWDLGMALEIMRLAEALDVVVLASGDGDFVPLLGQIRSQGLRVEVYSFAGSTANELVEACDRHVAIGDALLIRHEFGA